MRPILEGDVYLKVEVTFSLRQWTIREGRNKVVPDYLQAHIQSWRLQDHAVMIISGSGDCKENLNAPKLMSIRLREVEFE